MPFDRLKGKQMPLCSEAVTQEDAHKSLLTTQLFVWMWLLSVCFEESSIHGFMLCNLYSRVAVYCKHIKINENASFGIPCVIVLASGHSNANIDCVEKSIVEHLACLILCKKHTHVSKYCEGYVAMQSNKIIFARLWPNITNQVFLDKLIKPGNFEDWSLNKFLTSMARQSLCAYTPGPTYKR